jgi:hypothetical protein
VISRRSLSITKEQEEIVRANWKVVEQEAQFSWDRQKQIEATWREIKAVNELPEES